MVKQQQQRQKQQQMIKKQQQQKTYSHPLQTGYIEECIIQLSVADCHYFPSDTFCLGSFLIWTAFSAKAYNRNMFQLTVTVFRWHVSLHKDCL